MASMVVGGLFNAVAFAGAGFLFSHFNKHGYGEEIKRHNLAMEELSKAKEEFYEQARKRSDRIAQLREKVYIAKQDSKSTNQAFQDLADALEQGEKNNRELAGLTREPKLKDYYTESKEMKKYQNMAIGVVGVTVGGLVAAFV